MMVFHLVFVTALVYVISAEETTPRVEETTTGVEVTTVLTSVETSEPGKEEKITTKNVEVMVPTKAQMMIPSTNPQVQMTATEAHTEQTTNIETTTTEAHMEQTTNIETTRPTNERNNMVITKAAERRHDLSTHGKRTMLIQRKMQDGNKVDYYIVHRRWVTHEKARKNCRLMGMALASFENANAVADVIGTLW
ncbi:hypothetical protein Aduo_004249 [Ancylostoma duodenale]